MRPLARGLPAVVMAVTVSAGAQPASGRVAPSEASVSRPAQAASSPFPAPAPSTSAAPAPSTSAAPAPSTSATPAPSTSAMPAPSTSATPAPSTSAVPEAPWRLDAALGAPRWLHLGLEHRSRLEHLTDDFRAAAPSTASAWMLRTLARVELSPSFLVVSVELQDARALATDATTLNSAMVNPVELLRASIGVRREGLFRPGDVASVTLGRQTLDVGSRRLVARNDFRNTINAFTGVRAAWARPSGEGAQAFVVTPVRRFPSDAAELRAGLPAFDLEDPNTLFWGLSATSASLGDGVRIEGTLLGLHEADAPGAPTANRSLVTPGFRVLRRPGGPGVDVEVEGLLQAGDSRRTKADADQRTLEHLAVSLHASLGYRFAAPWSPRLLASYDYASGDEDPNDGFDTRFDPLFGARRFEFGPTGLYGALSRSNLSSPELRLEVTPGRHVDAFLAVRVAWLASARDAWVAGGLEDPSGRSGVDLGEQLEGRVRWQLAPGNLALELGAASLTRGAFARTAPGGRRNAALYVYTQLTGSL